MKKLYSIFLALLLFLISCGSGNKNEPVVVPTSITLSDTNIVLMTTWNTTLTATVIPYSTATWTSSNPAVATVNAAGLVTAVSGGEADIVVTAREATATCKVIVPTGSVDYSWLVVGEDQGRAMVWTDKGNYDLGVGIARSVDKSVDGTIFVAGESEGYPTIWGGDDFTKRVLSNNKGKGNFVYLKDDDVYVAGQANDRAMYWKNGVTNVLSGPSSGIVMLNSEARSMIVMRDGPFLVGSGEFSRIHDLVPETGKTQSQMRWEPGITYSFIGEGLHYLSINMVRIFNDSSVILLETEKDRSQGTVRGCLLARRDDGGSSGTGFGYDNAEDLYPYDVVSHGPFKTEPSKDNAVLIATNVGVYRVTGVPNKAYGPAGITVMPSTLLSGYGFSHSIKLLNNDIYSAGHNIIYKNGTILTTLSPTAEIYCLLVQ